MTKRPPLKIPARTKSTRTSVTSTARYSANPPQTPAITLFAALRSRRVDGIRALLPLTVLVRDREHHRGERRDRDGGLLERLEEAGDRDRRRGDEPEGEPVPIGVKLGQPCAGGADARPGLARNRGLLGRRRPVDDLRATLDVYAPAKLARAPSRMADRLVRRDPQEPVPDRPRLVVARERPICLQERRARDIER